MKVLDSQFIKSVADSNNVMIDDKKQIAFVGRSNVGKSSLLNSLANKKKLAKTSSTPGRTRLINYFLINNNFYFVDLPGYGYAKASKKDVLGWQSLIEPYLIDNERLKVVCVLVDSRHKPSDQDIQMINFLNYYQIPFIIIATKIDKFSKSQVRPALDKIANAIGVGIQNIFGVSSETKVGCDKILDKLDLFLEQ